MRVVIVGATGNVGTAVVERFRRAGADVVGVARRHPESAGPYAGVEWHAVDVSRSNARTGLERAFAGADAVVHLAWRLQPNHRFRTMRRTNVDGLRAVLDAVRAAGVPQIVVASSVGAYSAGPKDRAVDETWPTGGLHTSQYSVQKAAVERILDVFEREHPGTLVTRMRPGLVMQRRAGAEQARLFLGRFTPTAWLASGRIPVLPVPRSLVSQAVHADDLADAFLRVVERRAGGAFNIAAEPVIDARVLARVLGARHIPVPAAVLRALASLSWHLRLQPTDPGWLDIATNVPVMSTSRARHELDWAPAIPADVAVAEAIRGVAEKAGQAGSPPLA